jgi:hypothetical protein
MIKSKLVEGRYKGDIVYEITYKTPASEGVERFGSREKATLFAVEKMEELLEGERK